MSSLGRMSDRGNSREEFTGVGRRALLPSRSTTAVSSKAQAEALVTTAGGWS